MSGYSQEVYDAVRSRISGGDISSAVRDVLQHSFDISHIKCIIQQDMQIAIEEYKRPSVMLRPAISVDGNQFCILYGADLASGVAGFGDTADAAMRDFDKNWYSMKAAFAGELGEVEG